MSLKGVTRALSIAGLACVLACGESKRGEPVPAAPAPSYDELVAALDGCPQGDRPWRDAIAAATVAKKLDDLAARATALATRCAARWEPAWAAGECRFRLNPPDARPDYDEALKRARAARDDVGIACAANRVAALAYRSGDLALGETLYVEALASAVTVRREDLAAFIRNNLAGLQLEKGEYALAREELERAAEGLKSLGLDEAARAAAFNRAVIFAELGDAVAAREALEAVYREAQQAHDDATVREAAITLAKLHLATDELAPAQEWFEKARGGDPDVEALAELGLGRVALARADLPEAERLLASAAAKARARERLFELIAQTRWAEAEMLAGRAGPARTRLNDVIARSDAKDAQESAWAARWTLAKLCMRAEGWSEATRLLEEAIRILEAQKTRLDPLGEGLYFLRERAGVYVDLAFATARAPRVRDREARVLQISSRTKARALARALGSSAQDDGTSVTTDLAAVQRGLREGELLLDYLLGEEHGVVLAVSQREARVVTLAGRQELGAKLAAYLASLRPGSQAMTTSAGQGVRRALLDPVADLVARATRIYVVPDREIALLPFTALPLDAGGFLGDRVEIAVLPLAGAPARWDDKPADGRSARTPILLAGQPHQEGEAARVFPPLPWASFELSNVRSVWGADAATLLTGAAFDVEALTRALSGSAGPAFQTIHLATHAVASTKDPRRCGVIASNGERLGVEQIVAQLRLAPSSLVVLSACRTGIGEVVPGEGVIGLGWSFLRAGARGIVVSHWTVDDASAARLMIAFHRKLADGTDPVRALALASRELAASSTEYAHPMHWAPFVIVLRPQVPGAAEASRLSSDISPSRSQSDLRAPDRRAGVPA